MRNAVGVHLVHLRLRDFRNYARLDADFAPGFHLLLGDNAQGKTNMLEAIYLLATLRSFRGVGGAQMVRHGQKGYFVGASVMSQASHEIKMYWSPAERKLTLDGQPVRKLGDYLGTLRAVVFCTEDLQLIKGTARLRRRFMDLLLTQTHPVYLPLLQRYAAALRSRNALLKQHAPDETALEGFTRQLDGRGPEIDEISPGIVAANRAAGAGRLQPGGAKRRRTWNWNINPPSGRISPWNWPATARGKGLFAPTLIGPHRDELLLRLDGKSAAKYASEGQKRSIAIALKMTQAEYLSVGAWRAAHFAHRRHHGRTGRQTAGGVFAVAQPVATRRGARFS